MKMIMERRNKRRFDVCLDAIWDGSRGNSRARVTDLSEDGCYVDSMSEATPGETLCLRVLLPSGEWLELTGEVAHSFSSVGFGMRFVDLDAKQFLKLRSLLESLREPDERPALQICA